MNSLGPPRKSSSAAVNSGSAAVDATWGTAMQRMPAACAAAAPGAASSSTTQSPGAAPSRRAAYRKTSGSGFPCVTSSAETYAVRYAPSPVSASTASIAARDELDATTMAMPS